MLVPTFNSRPQEDLHSPDIVSKEQAAAGSSQYIEQLAASCPAHEASDKRVCQSHTRSAEPTDASDRTADRPNTTYQPASPAEQAAVETHSSELTNLPDVSSHLSSIFSWPQSELNLDSSGSMVPEGDAAVSTADCRTQDAPARTEFRAGDDSGALRRKPGRGEPTLSLSCSDKLARWGMLGLQVCAS